MATSEKLEFALLDSLTDRATYGRTWANVGASLDTEDKLFGDASIALTSPYESISTDLSVRNLPLPSAEGEDPFVIGMRYKRTLDLAYDYGILALYLNDDNYLSVQNERGAPGIRYELSGTVSGNSAPENIILYDTWTEVVFVIHYECCYLFVNGKQCACMWFNAGVNQNLKAGTLYLGTAHIGAGFIYSRCKLNDIWGLGAAFTYPSPANFTTSESAYNIAFDGAINPNDRTVPDAAVISNEDSGDGEFSFDIAIADEANYVQPVYKLSIEDDWTIDTDLKFAGSGTATVTGVTNDEYYDIGAYVIEQSAEPYLNSVISNILHVKPTAGDLTCPETSAKWFIERVISEMRTSTLFGNDMLATDVEGGVRAVYVTRQTPKGNVYPQATISMVLNESEQAWPAGYYQFILKYWMDQNTQNVEEKTQNFHDAVDCAFNRRGDYYNQVNVFDEHKLRVAFMKRERGDLEYDREHNKYFVNHRFYVVLSEGETFDDASAGNKAWV